MKNKKKLPVLDFFMEHHEAPMAVILVTFIIVVGIVMPGYIAGNYKNILKNCSLNLVMAAGMLCVLLVGSIDVSVAAVLELSAAVAGVLMRDGYIQSVWGMFAVGILIGALVGLFIGIITGYGHVLPIITTLGMTYVCRALIPMDFILGMNKIARIDLTDSFKDFILNKFFGLPLIVYIAFAVVLLIGIFLKYTTIGRRFYAVGSNSEAATMHGMNVNIIKMIAHTICGATAGLTGIMRLAEYNAIEKGACNGGEMYVIAACVLGGVSIMGGYGKMFGVVIGVVLISAIDSAIPQLFMNATMMKEFFKGIMILIAILLNVLLQRAFREHMKKKEHAK